MVLGRLTLNKLEERALNVNNYLHTNIYSY
jgi:hypothetical protein